MTDIEKTLNAWEMNSISVLAVQGESCGRTLKLTLIDREALTGASYSAQAINRPIDLTGVTARLYCLKPDGTKTLSDGTVTDATNGIVSFILPYQATSAAGDVSCQILLTKSDDSTLKTIGLTLNVQESDLDGAIESTSEYSSLVAALNEAKQVKSATIQVGTVTTGAAGGAVTVTNAGTEQAAVFNFSIPQGTQGPKGDKGDKGDTATSLTINGVYATLAALQAAHPTGKAGDVYEIGAADPYTNYLWDIDKAAWAEMGSIRGPKGDTGATGEQGAKGDTGVAGTSGISATIGVGTVTTGSPGSSATVTNSGTSSAAILNFTVPQGPKGDTGEQGPKGDTGATGVQGEKGATGATGSAGEAATISVGTVTTGNPGTSASITNAGTSSAAVLNFTIPKGEKGDTGSAGATGATGTSGAAATVTVGTTTTGNAGTNASVENSGTSSAAVFDFTIPKGDKGDTGATGAKGDKGDTGSTGAAATISIGTVTTGAAGSSASVTNSGISSAAILNFAIPKGADGQGADLSDYSTTAQADAKYVPQTRAVNGKSLSSNISLAVADIPNAVPDSREIAGQPLSADITLAQLIVTGLAAGTNGQANDSAKLAGVDATKFPQISSGSWTPTLYGATTAGTITYTARGGTYYKNGKLVLLLGHIEWSALSGGAGEIHIGGLPFAHNAAQSALLNLSSESITNATSFGDINAEIRAGADSINLWPMANALNFDSLATGGGWLSVAGLYLTNE